MQCNRHNNYTGIVPPPSAWLHDFFFRIGLGGREGRGNPDFCSCSFKQGQNIIFGGCRHFVSIEGKIRNKELGEIDRNPLPVLEGGK